MEAPSIKVRMMEKITGRSNFLLVITPQIVRKEGAVKTQSKNPTSPNFKALLAQLNLFSEGTAGYCTAITVIEPVVIGTLEDCP